MNSKARTRLLIAAVVIVAVFAAGVVFVVQRQGAYYIQVSDLATGRYDGENVKVGGVVLQSTIARDDDGVHFVMQDVTGEANTVKVTYAGQMPGTFAGGVDVVVLGTYRAAEGLVAAEQLQTKCPSKYEGKAVTPSPAAVP